MADYRRLTPQDLWLTFTAEDPLSDHDPISRAVKRWRISVGVNPFDDPQTLDVEVPDDGVIGHAEASVLNLGGAHEAGINPLEALDAISAELHHLSEVYDDEEGWWSEDLHLADIGGLALLVETIELKPRYRGLGLGPAVLAGITERLGTGCSFAALEPSPIGDPSQEKASTTPPGAWSVSGERSGSSRSGTACGSSTWAPTRSSRAAAGSSASETRSPP